MGDRIKITLFYSLSIAGSKVARSMIFIFFGRNFAKIQSEKYDFNLCKGFCMEKNDPNLPD